MRIKRIDLCGFKSFCDRMHLDLRQSVTAVVGPNGCGKSNVVDALRWAMGEQSAKHLRGKAMADVIFNGSDSRGPSGMAEISITFENDGNVPPEFLQYNEITVTRRLHRDGTSEYLLNRLPVRLRDVTNLFLGTGVGTRAYSIIEQGRVGLIVSSKPVDRRYFIEEAAGITKYRRRKQAAERRMDATRNNLLRVTDVIEEIGTRLGSLRRQAKKAERYKQYKTEMRDIELWAASHKLLELVAVAKVIEGSVADIERERVQAASTLSESDATLAAAREEAARHERALNGQQEALYQIDNRVRLGESQVEFQLHEATELDQRAERADVEMQELARQMEDSEAQREKVAEELSLFSQRRDELQQELLSREVVLGDCREESGAFERTIEDERAAASDAEQAAARAGAAQRALRQRRDDLGQRAERAREESVRVDVRRAELELVANDIDGQLGGLRTDLEQLVQRREDAQARSEMLAQTAERGEAELEVLRTELHRRRSRLASLQEIQQRYEGFGRGTRAIMQRLNGEAHSRGVFGLVADIIEAPHRYETALESVLGQRLGTVIVESEQVGLDAIRYLKDHAEGRSSFIPRENPRATSLLANAPVGVVWDSDGGGLLGGGGAGGVAAAAATARRLMLMPPPSLLQRRGVIGPLLELVRCKGEYRRVAESLLEDVVLVESLEVARALWDDFEGRTLVTLEGEILHPDGTVTGGSLDAENSGVLRQKREIKELGAIIEGLEADYERALDAHVAVKAELAQLRQVLDEATRDGHDRDKAILTREKDLGRIGSEIEGLELRRQELDRELEELEGSLRDLAEEEQRLHEEIVAARAAARLAHDTLHLLGRARMRVRTSLEAAQTAVTNGKVAFAQVGASCDALVQQGEQLTRLGEERTLRIQRLQEGAAEGRERAQVLRAKVDEQKTELESLRAERAAQQQALEKGRAEYEARLEKVAEIDGSLKSLRERIAELDAAIGEKRVERRELAMRLEHLDEQIFERYHEELARVAGDYHLRPPVGEDQLERLEQLRQLCHRMGEINLTAIEEYEELKQRFDFLDGHKSDLEDALSQLTRAIQKINRTCRKRFKETFDAVNERFQVLFPRLFNGGNARLVLTDESGDGDVLQGGVDIVAQPPGKKLQSLDMMSGGEKALTAVSLIFAMFMVKPTPFCLLDEVDAPLDEANVIRFREIVKDMSDQSQFIVITHNRRTMEIADRLYGVTMEEPGISKLVSVKLGEMDQLKGARKAS
ncbi:MAG: chromosome segregation protein SMC [Myxococcales bacterium]|nr:chromosome segregation protein SMC [Myxococcales bacterium]